MKLKPLDLKHIKVSLYEKYHMAGIYELYINAYKNAEFPLKVNQKIIGPLNESILFQLRQQVINVIYED
jgi:hypothetical protein